MGNNVQQWQRNENEDNEYYFCFKRFIIIRLKPYFWFLGDDSVARLNQRNDEAIECNEQIRTATNEEHSLNRLR